jgi:hypothetical protein
MAHGAPRNCSCSSYFLAARELSPGQRIPARLPARCACARRCPEALADAPGFRRSGGCSIDDEHHFLRTRSCCSRPSCVCSGTRRCTADAAPAARPVARRPHIDPASGATRQQRRFLDTARQPRGVTLAFRLMHRLGILGRYLPLFGRITGQMQHDQLPHLPGRRAHPDGAAQPAPPGAAGIRPRIPAGASPDEPPSSVRTCCSWRPCSTTSPRAGAATIPAWARSTPAVSAARTA